jgi:hypothetical protein
VGGIGADDGLPVAIDEDSELGTELGVELDEIAGISVGPLLGTLLVDGNGTGDELPLGSRLKEGAEMGAELGEATGMSVRRMLGTLLVKGIGADDVLSIGFDEESETATELGMELDEATGIPVGTLLGRFPVDGKGTLPIGLDDGSKTGLSLGWMLLDDTELGIELGEATGMSVGPLLGRILDDGKDASDGLPLLGLDKGSTVGLLLVSRLAEGA